MDLEMPVLDGIEATRVLGLAMPGCRVVVLTASPSPEDLVRAKNAGAAGYLTKGCSAEDVVAAVVDAVAVHAYAV
jgi:DNA-binding NarL/FixJ family response regulator